MSLYDAVRRLPVQRVALSAPAVDRQPRTGDEPIAALPPAPTWRRGWLQRYTSWSVSLDAAAAGAAALLALQVRFGTQRTPREALLYGVLTAVAPLLWVACIALARAYEARYLGVGTEEFRRILWAAVGLTAGIATFSWATAAELARGYLIVLLPVMTLLSITARYAMRRRLHRVRERGEAMERVVVVGHERAVAGLVHQLREQRYHGLDVVGACVPDGAQDTALLDVLGVEVLGRFTDAARLAVRADIDVVAVLPCPEMEGSALRRLAWELEATDAELVVGPGLVEVAAPRLTVRPVCGLPLLHVDRPEFAGARRLVKGMFDRGVAALALLLLLPVFLGIAASIRMSSRGPALFRQTRVGRDGRTFTLYKFRTMHVDAEQRRAALMALNERSDGLLFKIRHDPRVTRAGRVLRRFSADELPQLINVVRGDMSLVGPRPPLPEEVAQYGNDVRRRLLVKPGLTGLWQVSGRSDLTWDESVRLDLRYVENWSLALDLHILWKTGSAVLRGHGAY